MPIPSMWQLESNQLPIVAAPERGGAPLCFFDVGLNAAPLCRIDFQANYVLPGIKTTAEPAIAAVTIPAYTGNTVTLSTDFVQVDAIVVGNTTFTPAIDSANPKPNEFTLTGSSLILHPSSLISGVPAQIVGGRASTPTDYVDPSILQLFYGLPVVAEIKWSLSAENHPSGSINLRVIGDGNERQVAIKFRKGQELSFAGIGFNVTSYAKKLISTYEAPGRMWEVSISLGGKWEKRKYQRPSFLNPAAAAAFSVPIQYNDPDCAIGGNPQLIGIPKVEAVSVNALARRVGVNFIAFSSAPVGFRQLIDTPSTVRVASTGGKPLGAWRIPIEKDAPRDATESWNSVADTLKRQNGSYLDYCSPLGVYARSIRSGGRWVYQVPSISIAYKGDCEKVTGTEGYAVEYQAVKLSGKFSEPPEQNTDEDTKDKNPPKVKWKKRDVKIRTLSSGDELPQQPPDNFFVIRNMGMNFDQSGPSKEFIEATTHDGVEMMKRRRVYGAAFNSDQVTEDLNEGEAIGTNGRKHGPVLAPAISFWQEISQETTETIVDEKTRYQLGSKTTGYKKGRFQQEGDALEVLDYVSSINADIQNGKDPDPDDLYRLSLYRFQDFPLYSVEQKKLVQFGTYYRDVAKDPIPTDYEKVCNRDGSSYLKAVRNPNWAEPMFAIASLSYSNSFAHTRNPDSEKDDPLPDLTQGEERQSYTTIQLIPSESTTLQLTLETGKLAKEKYDTFVEHHQEASTQGALFGEYTGKRTFAYNDGRPQAAQRLPDLYEKEEPEAKNGNPDVFKTAKQYEYLLCTPGHNASEPSTGSISFQYAQYLTDALVGARTDLKYRDIQESIEYSATIPTNFQIRPMDYIGLNDGANQYSCRVISVENTIILQGELNDYPLVVAPQNTEIKAGIDREIPVSVRQREVPKPPNPPELTKPDPNSDRSFGLTLGDVLPRSLQTRGNY